MNRKTLPIIEELLILKDICCWERENCVGWKFAPIGGGIIFGMGLIDLGQYWYDNN